MGGRGAIYGGQLNGIFPIALSLSPSEVAYTNVYNDARYSQHAHEGQLRGSGGKLISREMLHSLVNKEERDGLAHVKSVTVQAGTYKEDFKIVDNIPHNLVLPAEHQQTVSPDKLQKAKINLNWQYNVITPQDETEGTMRHYLKGYKDWHIIARPAHIDVDRYTFPDHAFHMESPTLTWVSSGQIRELYIPGVDSDQFRKDNNLHIFLEKGAPTAAKRISRIMRDYLLIQAMPPEDVKISYMDLDTNGAKIYDGSGLVSQQMVEKMLISPDLTPEKREKLQWEIKHTKRIEYTILTPRGQDKGHAIVSDHLLDESGQLVDFLLPKDTKLDTQDTSGKTIVGINFVHHQDRMRLDDQSLINHRNFFPPEYLAERVEDRGQAFLADIDQGGCTDRQPLNLAKAAEVKKRPLSEFLASGGDVRWSPTLLRSHMNQHIKSILHVDDRGNERMRLPVEGARYYIKPDRVGKDAGIEGLNVPRGQIKIDPEYGTAWVNEDDWVQMQDSPNNRAEGIADILGGADNDDAVWLYPFSDGDDHGTKKVLAWRSPNAPGEYVVLKPTSDSHTIYWKKADGDVLSYPERFSSQLSARVDMRPKQTSSQIDPTTGGGMGEGQSYRVEYMEKAVERSTENAGTLGRFVNILMVYEAIGRDVDMPAPLEDVIDAMNKTGEDLTPINRWINERADELRQEGVAVPEYIQHRVGTGTGNEDGQVQPLKKTEGHWLDTLTERVRNHVNWMETRRDEMIEATTLPDAVLDYAFEYPHSIRLGAAYLRHYNGAYNHIRRQRPSGLRKEDYDQLRHTAESFLANYPEEQEEILLGAFVNLHMRGKGKSDAALWLSGEDTGQSFKPSIGNKMVSALRKAGVLQELDKPVPTNDNVYSSYQIASIQNIWRAVYEHENASDPAGKINKGLMGEAKDRVQIMANTSFRQMPITVRKEGDDFIAYTYNQKQLGKIEPRKGETFSDGQQFKVQHALAENGNLHVAILPHKYEEFIHEL